MSRALELLEFRAPGFPGFRIVSLGLQAVKASGFEVIVLLSLRFRGRGLTGLALANTKPFIEPFRAHIGTLIGPFKGTLNP